MLLAQPTDELLLGNAHAIVGDVTQLRGVDIVLGADTGAVPDQPFGYVGPRELEIHVRLGMSAMNTLMAANCKAAKPMGLDDQGEIATAYQAGQSSERLCRVENGQRVMISCSDPRGSATCSLFVLEVRTKIHSVDCPGIPGKFIDS